MSRSKLSSLLCGQEFGDAGMDGLCGSLLAYARGIAAIEKSIVVVSDMKHSQSYIYTGDFGKTLGLVDVKPEFTMNSIWETAVLNLVHPDDLNDKYLNELRFFNYVRQLPPKHRSDIYFVAKLRLLGKDGNYIMGLHRMFYIYESEKQSARYALCLYSPLTFDFQGRSGIVNACTGVFQPFDHKTDNDILSKRELEVLAHIQHGRKSNEIAAILGISKNTVSRHRQEIIAKLQVKNSIEACRIASELGLLC